MLQLNNCPTDQNSSKEATNYFHNENANCIDSITSNLCLWECYVWLVFDTTFWTKTLYSILLHQSLFITQTQTDVMIFKKNRWDWKFGFVSLNFIFTTLCYRQFIISLIGNKQIVRQNFVFFAWFRESGKKKTFERLKHYLVSSKYRLTFLMSYLAINQT